MKSLSFLFFKHFYGQIGPREKGAHRLYSPYWSTNPWITEDWIKAWPQHWELHVLYNKLIRVKFSLRRDREADISSVSPSIHSDEGITFKISASLSQWWKFDSYYQPVWYWILVFPVPPIWLHSFVRNYRTARNHWPPLPCQHPWLSTDNAVAGRLFATVKLRSGCKVAEERLAWEKPR